jgi:hypothetical protein
MTNLGDVTVAYSKKLWIGTLTVKEVIKRDDGDRVTVSEEGLNPPEIRISENLSRILKTNDRIIVVQEGSNYVMVYGPVINENMYCI